MNKPLFKEFEAVTSKAWKQKIQVDLKGADYNETLIWKTNEGIAIKPFYHADEFKTFPKISASKATEWKIGQTIKVSNSKDANLKAIDAINHGAEHILFQINSEEIVLNHLIQNIDLDIISVTFNCNFFLEKYIETINSVISKLSQKAQKNINFQTDIIHNLAKTGNWYSNLKEDLTRFKNITSTINQLYINLSLYQNAGANYVQQLAYGLAHANEYLNHLDSEISSKAKQALLVNFNVSVGSNYFFEIAKLRALRLLWATLASEYGVNLECKITAKPSRRNKTIYDYNVNMLRTTTECMSAIIGGANIIYNLPYDALYHNENEFGDRISRNQLLILKHESYFNKVNNPADGSYYIEKLTEQFSEKALQLFKDIERNGGFLHQLKEGTIQRKIIENATKEQTDLDSGKLVLLGTNKQKNIEDKMKSNIEISPFLKVEKRKTLIKPIIVKRLAEAIENKRLKNE